MASDWFTLGLGWFLGHQNLTSLYGLISYSLKPQITVSLKCQLPAIRSTYPLVSPFWITGWFTHQIHSKWGAVRCQATSKYLAYIISSEWCSQEKPEISACWERWDSYTCVGRILVFGREGETLSTARTWVQDRSRSQAILLFLQNSLATLHAKEPYILSTSLFRIGLNLLKKRKVKILYWVVGYVLNNLPGRSLRREWTAVCPGGSCLFWRKQGEGTQGRGRKPYGFCMERKEREDTWAPEKIVPELSSATKWQN